MKKQLTSNHIGDNCGYLQKMNINRKNSFIPPGIHSIQDIKHYGQLHHFCPFFLANDMLPFADISINDLKTLFDWKTTHRETSRECVVIFNDIRDFYNLNDKKNIT